MTARTRQPGFTLIELLVVVSIISLLVSLLLPSLSRAKQIARSTQCLSQLHNLGVAATQYMQEHGGFYWAANEGTWAEPVYFWGAPGDPVDFRASQFMGYLDYQPAQLWCPAQPWGSYVPQAGGKGVNEPTTTYGYNGYCLDPPYWGRGLPRKKQEDIRFPAQLFVFADSAMYWTPGGVPILQNSTSLDPVTLPWGPNTTATTQFRHGGRANALCADGHADSFGPEGGTFTAPEHKIGFVGTANEPHYDQP